MNPDTLHAVTIGPRAAQALQPGQAGRVLSRHRKAIHLMSGSGQFCVLVWDSGLAGPLHVVLKRKPPAPSFPAGAEFALTGNGAALETEGATLHLAGARPWAPEPGWRHLRSQRRQIAQTLESQVLPAFTAAWRSLPAAGLSQALSELMDSAGTSLPSDPSCAQSSQLAAALGRFVGLGPGLTPAGDDWLAGWFFGARLWLDETLLDDVAAEVLRASATRTGIVSRAYLAPTCHGELDAVWSAFLSGLAAGDPDAALSEVLARGATSGYAMVAGFITGLLRQPTLSAHPALIL